MKHLTKILFLIFISGSLFSIDIEINNYPFKNYSISALEPLLYSIPVETEIKQGISIDEILPLFYEVYKLTVFSGSRSESWEDDNLAETLTNCFLLKTENSWDLCIKDNIFRNVDKISVYGEEIPDSKLEVWVSWEGVPKLKKEIRRFEELHNITVKTTEVPKTDSKLISVLRGGGDLPDVVMIQSDYLPALISSKALQNLNYMLPYMSEKAGSKVFRVSGKTWAIPFYYDTQLLFYNKKLLTDFPQSNWTLSDLEKTAEDLKSRGISPISWNAYSAFWFIPFQIGFGKNGILNSDGSITINDAQTKKALEYILFLKDKGYLKILEKDALISLFVSGKTAMILSGSYSISHFSELGIDFGVQCYPFNTETGKAISPLLDFKAFAITRKTKHPILARRLIQYLSGTGVQQRFPPALSKLPADLSIREIIKTKNQYYPVMLKSSETGTPVPSGKSYKIYKNTMWKLLRFVLTDQMGVDEVLETGQKIINEKLK